MCDYSNMYYVVFEAVVHACSYILQILSTVQPLFYMSIFIKPGMRGLWPRMPGFLKLLWFVRRYACVCLSVCPPSRPLITSDVIWCDIGHVRLVKQVLRLFPAFNYFIRHFPLIKWMGVAILTQHVVNSCQRKLR